MIHCVVVSSMLCVFVSVCVCVWPGPAEPHAGADLEARWARDYSLAYHSVVYYTILHYDIV